MSKRLETAKKFIGQFATLDSAALEAVLAENFSQEFAPASMNPPGPFDKPGFLQYHANMRNVLAGFPVTAREYIESESSNRVTVWATSRTIFHDEVKDNGIDEKEWSYSGEYIFIFTMDETGEKITRTVEFLDSKETTEKLMVLMKRANQNREKILGAKGN